MVVGSNCRVSELSHALTVVASASGIQPNCPRLPMIGSDGWNDSEAGASWATTPQKEAKGRYDQTLVLEPKRWLAVDVAYPDAGIWLTNEDRSRRSTWRRQGRREPASVGQSATVSTPEDVPSARPLPPEISRSARALQARTQRQRAHRGRSGVLDNGKANAFGFVA